MGLRTKQASGDQGHEWDQNLLQSGAPETPTPLQSEPLKCPRCGSTNTKFCYYNNYNKSQPRHFCKSCKRHWTKGGTLRSVPIGGCRKNKRPKISPAAVANFRQSFALGANPAGDRKGASNILCQALSRSPPPLLNETATGINVSVSPGHDSAGNNTNITDSTGLSLAAADRKPNTTEFQLFSNLELNNASLIPTYEIGNIDSMEESSVTTANIDYPSEAWLGFDTNICSLELAAAATTATANYWNWSEIDALTSADDLNISWDEDDVINNGEARMKP